MAQYLITLTDLQDKGLQFVVDQANADPQRDPQAVKWTPLTFKQDQDSKQADDYVRRMNESTKGVVAVELQKVIDAGDTAKLQAVKDALGIVDVVKP